jgi:hypothetical protein
MLGDILPLALCLHFLVLFTGNVNYSDYVVYVMAEWMSMEHWWNDTGKAKTKVLGGMPALMPHYPPEISVR